MTLRRQTFCSPLLFAGIAAALLAACGSSDRLVQQEADGGPGRSGKNGSSASKGVPDTRDADVPTGQGGVSAGPGVGGSGGILATGGEQSSGGRGGDVHGGGGSGATMDAGTDAGSSGREAGVSDAARGGGSASGGRPSTGDSGVDGSPGGGANPDLLARPCTKSSDCGPGLHCLTVTSNEFAGDGVANGICTLDCSADISAPIATVCTAIDPTALCLQISDTKALCTEACSIGPLPASSSKCHNRTDLACTDPNELGIGYCTPTCRGDFDCSGRKCDLGTGVCRDAIEPGRTLPIGTKCDPNAATDTCQGACVRLEGTSTGFCSGVCRLGSALNCNMDPRSTAPAAAYCLFPVTLDSDYGDLGFCGQLCDCNDDCTNPDFVCSPVSGLQALAGRAGGCTDPTQVNGDPSGIPCH